MKNFKMAMIALFALVMVSNVSAQDSNNPWAISFGVNNIDFRKGSGFGDVVKDYLGTNDWNVLPSISRISAEKYIQDGFSVQLVGSLNQLNKSGGLLYFAIDANVKYDVNKLVDFTFGSTSQYFDPYVYLGVGHTSIDKVGETMLNLGFGFNTWFNDSIGINFQSGAKRNFSDKVADHFQHSLSIVFRFGGKDAE